MTVSQELLAQAEALEVLMKEMGIKLDKVISLNVPDELIVGRVTGRRVCKDCGASFHVEFNPSKVEGVCDLCGGELIQEKTTQLKLLQKDFLNIMHKQLLFLISIWKEESLPDLDGTKDIDEITKEIFNILG